MRAAVLGATGYAGQEVVRILMRHPEMTVVALTSEREAGEPTSRIFLSLRNGPGVFIHAEQLGAESVDVVISCQAPGAAAKFFGGWLNGGATVMDLSADFRFRDASLYASVYGPHPVPDLLTRSQSGYADDPSVSYDPTRPIFGNPGCYPTAFYTAVGPLLSAGLLVPYLIVDGKSGVSGAGRKPQLSTMMGEMAENVAAYNVPGRHRHTLEMEQASRGSVVFQPHLMPMARGMFLTIYWPGACVTAREVQDIWQDDYARSSFVDVLPSGMLPSVQRVRNTNRVEIAAAEDVRTGTLVLYSALDNLVKGAAGQAVQHLNQWFGWPRALGLG